MGKHGPPSTFWEFMAQHGVFEYFSTQELVLKMAYMGRFSAIKSIKTQDIETTQAQKKFHDFPEKFATTGERRGYPSQIWPNYAESQGFFLNLIRELQVSPMISQFAGYSAFHMT